MPLDKAQLLRHIFIEKKIREGMQCGRLANCSALAQEYEVSSKTILRDIDFLKNQQDAPIEYDASRHGYYFTEENYSLPTISLNESDLFAICIAEKALVHYENTPLYQKLAKVFRKIEAVLPDKVTVEPGWVDEHISVVGEFQTKINPDVWETVSNGLRLNRTVIILYQKLGAAKAVVRNVDPYHALRCQGEWYVVGHCHLRDSLRTFAVSRIRHAQLLDSDFAIPKDFNPADLTAGRFGLFGGGKKQEVRIFFDAAHAPYVREREWSRDQRLSEMKEGGLELMFTASDLNEVSRWILSWGGGVKALAPQELTRLVRHELAAALESYNAEGSG